MKISLTVVMLKPGLGLTDANREKALKMIGNFAIPPCYVPSGNPGSCYVNARLMMLTCYILKNGTEALMGYDNSYSFEEPISDKIRNANVDLILAANNYITTCKDTPDDTDLCKTIYLDVAMNLYSGNTTICNEAADDTFYKIIQYDKMVLTDDDYMSIIEKETNGDFYSYLIVVSGSYRDSMFIGFHETFLFYTNGRWILFDDLDCQKGIWSGRYIW